MDSSQKVILYCNLLTRVSWLYEHTHTYTHSSCVSPMFSLPNRNWRSGNMSRFLSLSLSLSSSLAHSVFIWTERRSEKRESWTSKPSYQKQMKCAAVYPSPLLTSLSKPDLTQSVCLIYTASTVGVCHLGLCRRRQKVYTMRSCIYFDYQPQTTVSTGDNQTPSTQIKGVYIFLPYKYPILNIYSQYMEHFHIVSSSIQTILFITLSCTQLNFLHSVLLKKLIIWIL